MHLYLDVRNKQMINFYVENKIAFILHLNRNILIRKIILIISNKLNKKKEICSNRKFSKVIRKN